MTKLSQKQIGEIRSREFLTDEVWIAWKQDFDELMAFRKSIKAKPDKYQYAILEMNKPWIEFYQSVLFHQPNPKLCVCRRCEKRRSQAPLFRKGKEV